MFKYYFKRFFIFLLFYVGLGLLINLVFTVKEFANLDTSVFALLKANAISVIFLLMEFCFAFLPLSVYLAVLPKKFHNSAFDKYFTGAVFVVFFFLTAFKTVSEYFFWEEFSSRFNFIAVDYLVYTQEVMENIYQSYPIVKILIGIFLFAIIIWFIFRNAFVANGAKVPSAKKRYLWLFANILLCVFIAFKTSLSFGDISLNRYNNELAKSGAYSFVYAFFHNELDYKTFYTSLPQANADEIIKRDLGGSNITFKEGGLLRSVKANGQEKRANVVIVLMESMGAKFMDATKEFDMPEVTPNLSRLAKEGIYFPHTYSTGTRTVRGIEAVTLSIPPLPGMSIVRRKDNENLQGIGSIFAQRGYDLKFIYGGYGYFDNMNYYFASNGFNIIDRVSMPKEEVSFANAWGVCDGDLFARAVKEADKDYKANKPFFQFVLTTSNHRPFTYPDGKIDIPSGDGRRGAVKYSDYAVGEFMKEAAKKPWFSNTIFVFIGDHGAGSSGKQELAPEEHRVAFVIYAPHIFKPKSYKTSISQIDVTPTLLSLMNFSYDSLFFGRDAAAADYKTRIFLNNYQKAGMIEDDIMTVLKPVKEADFYKGIALEPQKDKEAYQSYLDTAAAYYQKADEWKLHLRSVK